jgi:hypothetical protein
MSEGSVSALGSLSPAPENRLTLSQSIWAHQLGEPGLFPAPKLTDLYRRPSIMST